MNQDEEHKSDVIADQAGAELAELRAENERLRKALGGLLHIIEEHGTPIQKAHATKLLEAREALEVKG